MSSLFLHNNNDTDICKQSAIKRNRRCGNRRVSGTGMIPVGVNFCHTAVDSIASREESFLVGLRF